jgi:hypothetical protein
MNGITHAASLPPFQVWTAFQMKFRSTALDQSEITRLEGTAYTYLAAGVVSMTLAFPKNIYSG